MSLPESPVSADKVERILATWDPTVDTCRDEPLPLKLEWPCTNECKDAFGEDMVITKTRDLPVAYEVRAISYITLLVSKYPFQLRQEMARPMWHRFLDVWNDTGDHRKAMRVI